MEYNAITWSLAVLCTFLVVLRIAHRVHNKVTFGWEDFFVVFSTILILTSTSLFSWVLSSSEGQPLAALNKPQVKQLLKRNVTFFAFLEQCPSWPKLSFALLLIRVLDPKPMTRWALKALAILGVLLSLIMAILGLFSCTPAAKQWESRLQDKCSPDLVLGASLAQSIFSGLQDFVFALYPIVIIARVQMPPNRRMRAMLCMALGLIAGVLAIFRSVKIASIFNDRNFYQQDMYIELLTLVEGDLVLFAATFGTTGPVWSAAYNKASARLAPLQRYPWIATLVDSVPGASRDRRRCRPFVRSSLEMCKDSEVSVFSKGLTKAHVGVVEVVEVVDCDATGHRSTATGDTIAGADIDELPGLRESGVSTVADNFGVDADAEVLPDSVFERASDLELGRALSDRRSVSEYSSDSTGADVLMDTMGFMTPPRVGSFIQPVSPLTLPPRVQLAAALEPYSPLNRRGPWSSTPPRTLAPSPMPRSSADSSARTSVNANRTAGAEPSEDIDVTELMHSLLPGRSR